MSNQQLIDAALQQLELIAADVAVISIDYAGRKISILTHAYAKHVLQFSQLEPVEPRPKRIKAVKGVG